MSYTNKKLQYRMANLLKRSTILRKLYAKLFDPERSRQFELTQWVNQGMSLCQSHHLQGVTLNRDECWIMLPNGLELRYLHEIAGAGAEPSIYRGEYEAEITQLLTSELQDASTFIDIGANLGWFSLHIAQMYPNITIHAFEPGEYAYTNITKNIARNRFQQQVRLNNVVVSDHCGVEQFTNQQLGHALNHISRNTTIKTQLREVKATTLDRYISDNTVTTVALIKCDVEGAELLVINGAEKLLERDKPKLLLEINPLWMSRFGHRPEQLWEQLKGYGYDYRIIDTDGEQLNSGNFRADIGDGANVFFSTTLKSNP